MSLAQICHFRWRALGILTIKAAWTAPHWTHGPAVPQGVFLSRPLTFKLCIQHQPFSQSSVRLKTQSKERGNALAQASRNRRSRVPQSPDFCHRVPKPLRGPVGFLRRPTSELLVHPTFLSTPALQIYRCHVDVCKACMCRLS